MNIDTLNTELKNHYDEIYRICGVLHQHFDNETKPLIEIGDFEGCFKLLDTWIGEYSEVQKFQLFNKIAKLEAELSGEEPRNYHKRYNK